MLSHASKTTLSTVALLAALLFSALLASNGQAQSNSCQIPPSGPWPPCATGGQTTQATNRCVIPPSGPWPACARNGGATTMPTSSGGGCVIPSSGPWPPCATGGQGSGASATASTSCVIPPSGPWPACARGGNAPAQPAQPTVSQTPTLPTSVRLVEVASGFQSPVYLTHAGDGRIFVVEKFGRIKLLNSKATFLDINLRVRSAGSEQGLLSMAFHPDYQSNGRFFVYYTNNDSDVVISEFRASGNSADPNSERILLTVDQPFENHNGGQIAFGRDGMLYIGLGDGGAAGDPLSHGLNPRTLLGSMLRIDVNGADPYGIPAGNPYRGHAENRGEIWSIGLRNPWRFSFDRATGHLYIGDVGQDTREEISRQPAGRAGLNFGWNAWEGTHCFTSNCRAVAQTPPIVEYGHDQGCSVTGGYVYRGMAFSQWRGVYFYGDYCQGKVWATTQPTSGQWQVEQVADTTHFISSFGEDAAGELYVVSIGGKIFQLQP